MKIFMFEITKDEIAAGWRLLREGVRRLVVPKNSRDRIGIVVALQTEGDLEKQRLERDFVQQLNKSFQHSELTNLFKVILFPQSIATKINSPDEAANFLKRARGHFVVYGDMVQRQISGTTNYVFRLSGLVVHRPIPAAQSQQFSREFREVLPEKIAFKTCDELLGFEFTKQWVGLVVKYVIAIAAALSRDLELAARLLRNVESEIEAQPKYEENPVLVELQKRTRLRIAEVLRSQVSLQYDRFAKSRDRGIILATEGLVHDLLTRDPEDYAAKLMNSMRLFFLGKAGEAVDQLQNIKSKDPTWRFSLGFLYAFNGEIDEALEQYKKAWYETVEPNLINDVDIFITEIMAENSSKPQLKFFRGLVNLKGKPDYLLAKRDFENFLGNNDCNQYPKLIGMANKYLGEIQTHLGV